MLTSISLLVFGISFILLYAIFKNAFAHTFAVQKRINQVNNSDEVFQEEKSFFQSYLSNREEKQKKKLKHKKNKQVSNKLQKQLEESGLIKKYSVVQWLLLKNAMTLLLCSVFFFLAFFSKKDFGMIIMLEVFIVIVIHMLFRFVLLSSIAKRKQEILKNLPNTLDLVTASVEAGLSFDGAIARVMDSTDNALTFEFARALKEIRMGIERKKALRALSDRCNVKELTTVINALIQADDLGVSLGKVLRIQSEQVREFRKQAAREKSMKAPVKMLFPLIFFIFPTVFIVILGPAVIRIMNFFK